MNIEPIGSMMTLQAQPTANVKPVEQADRSAEYNPREANTPSAMPDMTTQVVEGTQSKADANANAGEGNESAYQQAEQATNESIRKAVEQFNKVSGANSEAVFGIHEGTNRVTIKIVDKETKKTIKELPPEKTLDMIAKVWEMAGILIDEKR